jgi:ribulose-phosphate 3-epimerase
VKIIPTIFAHNSREFSKRFGVISKISKYAQIDFMDGKFVSAKSVDIGRIPKLRGNFEAHLMVSNPRKYISKLKERGFRRVILHIESLSGEEIFEEINKNKMSTLLAINPETPISKLEPFLKRSGGVMFREFILGKRAKSLSGAFMERLNGFEKYIRTYLFRLTAA